MSKDGPIGLALSGGGYRASLFHLGAMRRLNELGLLEKVGCISSVSGGSILSGFIADKMLAAGKNTPQFDDWETSIARGFRWFVGEDIRTFLVLRYALINAVQPQKRAARLAEILKERLTDRYLTDLPAEGEGTSFMFLATDYLESVAWEFEQQQVGHYKMSNKNRFPSDGILIAQAVAASASFPPIFGPVRFPVKNRKGDGEYVAWLTDGGVYDNLGMEPVWKGNYSRVLVSDGGAVLDDKLPKWYGSRLFRYTSIATDQVRSRRQWEFIAKVTGSKKYGEDYDGTMWRNGSKKKKFKKKAPKEGKARIAEMEELGWYGYDDEDDGTIDKYIAKIRTDLDRFTTAEAKILENHGYFNADIALRAFLPEMLDDVKAPFQVPHKDPEYLDESRVRAHLKNSGSRWHFIERYFKQ